MHNQRHIFISIDYSYYNYRYEAKYVYRQYLAKKKFVSLIYCFILNYIYCTIRLFGYTPNVVGASRYVCAKKKTLATLWQRMSRIFNFTQNSAPFLLTFCNFIKYPIHNVSPCKKNPNLIPGQLCSYTGKYKQTKF